jgi:hypothetical protein
MNFFCPTQKRRATLTNAKMQNAVILIIITVVLLGLAFYAISSEKSKKKSKSKSNPIKNDISPKDHITVRHKTTESDKKIKKTINIASASNPSPTIFPFRWTYLPDYTEVCVGSPLFKNYSYLLYVTSEFSIRALSVYRDHQLIHTFIINSEKYPKSFIDKLTNIQSCQSATALPNVYKDTVDEITFYDNLDIHAEGLFKNVKWDVETFEKFHHLLSSAMKVADVKGWYRPGAVLELSTEFGSYLINNPAVCFSCRFSLSFKPAGKKFKIRLNENVFPSAAFKKRSFSVSRGTTGFFVVSLDQSFLNAIKIKDKKGLLEKAKGEHVLIDSVVENYGFYYNVPEKALFVLKKKQLFATFPVTLSAEEIDSFADQKSEIFDKILKQMQLITFKQPSSSGKTEARREKTKKSQFSYDSKLPDNKFCVIITGDKVIASVNGRTLPALTDFPSYSDYAEEKQVEGYYAIFYQQYQIQHPPPTKDEDEEKEELPVYYDCLPSLFLRDIFFCLTISNENPMDYAGLLVETLTVIEKKSDSSDIVLSQVEVLTETILISNKQHASIEKYPNLVLTGSALPQTTGNFDEIVSNKVRNSLDESHILITSEILMPILMASLTNPVLYEKNTGSTFDCKSRTEPAFQLTANPASLKLKSSKHTIKGLPSLTCRDTAAKKCLPWRGVVEFEIASLKSLIGSESLEPTVLNFVPVTAQAEGAVSDQQTAQVCEESKVLDSISFCKGDKKVFVFNNESLMGEFQVSSVSDSTALTKDEFDQILPPCEISAEINLKSINDQIFTSKRVTGQPRQVFLDTKHVGAEEGVNLRKCRFPIWSTSEKNKTLAYMAMWIELNVTVEQVKIFIHPI